MIGVKGLPFLINEDVCNPDYVPQTNAERVGREMAIASSQRDDQLYHEAEIADAPPV